MARFVKPKGSINPNVLMDELIAADPALKGVLRVEHTPTQVIVELPDTYTEAALDAKIAVHTPNRPDPIENELKKDPKNLTDKERLDRIEKILKIDTPK